MCVTFHAGPGSSHYVFLAVVSYHCSLVIQDPTERWQQPSFSERMTHVEEGHTCSLQVQHDNHKK